MIPGPNLIYKCPKCKKTVYRGSLRSGNTLGAKLFSDGRRIAPMLPEFPFIVKCKECNTFFWLNDKNKIGKYSRWFNFGKKWANPDVAEILSLNEYFEAIKSKIYSNKDEEQFLRLNLWRAFNDRTREGRDIFLTEDDKDIYESNCIALIEMLDKNETKNKIMIAELYRNLGKYIECNNMLNSIIDKGCARLKEILKKECEKNNKYVIEILEEVRKKKSGMLTEDRRARVRERVRANRARDRDRAMAKAAIARAMGSLTQRIKKQIIQKLRLFVRRRG